MKIVLALIMVLPFHAEALEVGSSPTYSALSGMNTDGNGAVGASSMESASVRSGLTADGSGQTSGSGAVYAGGVQRTYARGAASSNSPSLKADSETVPAPKGEEIKDKIPGWAMYGGAAALGALQGFFTGGPLGAVIGVGLGLAGAYFYKKGDYGTTFGMMGGSIIGAALGGPIGGLIGAVVGGILGHFIGKLFS